jgi:CubicO group peptidase (beta-lactamase class C family)
MRAVKSMKPVFAPNQKSSYSNVAYELLGVVIEKVTNQTFESYMTEAIFKPLNMTKTSLSTPPDSAGVIPLGPQYWDVDEGIQSPTGGIYASSSDLSKFLRYILTHYNGITHAANWLHPVSPATGLNSFYGMPWEILATDRILQKSRRTVQLVTKSGGLPGYVTIIATVPDYDLGITILIAGNFDLMPKASEIVSVAAVRAAEEVAIRQLEGRYAGTYVSSNPHLNSSITLVADHRGLVVSEFISNATDMMKPELRKIFGGPKEGGSYVQLVPTLLFQNETAQSGELWRITVVAERTEGEHPILDDFCMTNLGGMAYRGIPADEVVFWGEKGEAFGMVELTGFRAKLLRQEDEVRENAQSHQEILEL